MVRCYNYSKWRQDHTGKVHLTQVQCALDTLKSIETENWGDDCEAKIIYSKGITQYSLTTYYLLYILNIPRWAGFNIKESGFMQIYISACYRNDFYLTNHSHIIASSHTGNNMMSIHRCFVLEIIEDLLQLSIDTWLQPASWDHWSGCGKN